MKEYKTMAGEHPIDQRLLDIRDEYFNNGKEDDFVWMLYMLLDISTEYVHTHVMHKHNAGKAAETKRANAPKKKIFEELFEDMTIQERIDALNMNWEDMPNWMKENAEVVKWPEEFNSLRVSGKVSKDARQKEVFGARLLRCMQKYGFVTSDNKPDYDRFTEYANAFAADYDLAARPGKRAQHTRVNNPDMKAYTQKRVTPKRDKFAVISAMMNVPEEYLGGYGSNTPPASDMFGAKFRKKRA